MSWLPSPRVSSTGCRAQAALSSHGEDGRLSQDLTTHPGSLLGADTTQDKFTCDSPSRGSLLASVSTIMGTKEWAVYPHPHPLNYNYAVYLHSRWPLLGVPGQGLREEEEKHGWRSHFCLHLLVSSKSFLSPCLLLRRVLAAGRGASEWPKLPPSAA